MAAVQCEQDVTAVMSNPETKMTKACCINQIVVGRPSPPIEILLDRADQSIQARIKDGTMVQVDNPMGARAEITGLQSTVLAPLQGDQCTIAITDRSMGFIQQ